MLAVNEQRAEGVRKALGSDGGGNDHDSGKKGNERGGEGEWDGGGRLEHGASDEESVSVLDGFVVLDVSRNTILQVYLVELGNAQ